MADINELLQARRTSLRVERMANAESALALVSPTDSFSDHKKWQIWRVYGGSVFVSHQADDREFIRKTFIRKIVRGPLWHPESVPLDVFCYSKADMGANLYRELIGHALLVCGSAVIFISKNSAQSYWVPLECDIILARRIPFSIVTLDETPVPHVHPYLLHHLGIVNRIRGQVKMFDLVRHPSLTGSALERTRKLFWRNRNHWAQSEWNKIPEPQ